MNYLGHLTLYDETAISQYVDGDARLVKCDTNICEFILQGLFDVTLDETTGMYGIESITASGNTA